MYNNYSFIFFVLFLHVNAHGPRKLLMIVYAIDSCDFSTALLVSISVSLCLYEIPIIYVFEAAASIFMGFLCIFLMTSTCFVLVACC